MLTNFECGFYFVLKRSSSLFAPLNICLAKIADPFLARELDIPRTWGTPTSQDLGADVAGRYLLVGVLLQVVAAIQVGTQRFGGCAGGSIAPVRETKGRC